MIHPALIICVPIALYCIALGLAMLHCSRKHKMRSRGFDVEN